MTSKCGLSYILAIVISAIPYLIPVFIIPYLFGFGKKQGNSSMRRDFIRHIKRRKF